MQSQDSLYESFMERQLQQIIDEKLEEFDFNNVCQSITRQIISKVNNQFVEQNNLKSQVDSIEARTNALIDSLLVHGEIPSLPTQGNRLSSKSSVNKNPTVIVIDDDDDIEENLKDDEFELPESITSAVLENIGVSIEDICNIETTNKEREVEDESVVNESPAENVHETSAAQKTQLVVDQSSNESAISSQSSETLKETNLLEQNIDGESVASAGSDRIVIDSEDSSEKNDKTSETIDIETNKDQDKNIDNRSVGNSAGQLTQGSIDTEKNKIIYLKSTSAETFLGSPSDDNVHFTPNTDSPSKDPFSTLSPPSSIFEPRLTPERIDINKDAGKVSLLKTLEKVTDKYSEIEPLDFEDISSNRISDNFNSKRYLTCSTEESNEQKNASSSHDNTLSPPQKKRKSSPLTGERLRNGLKVILPKRSPIGKGETSASSPDSHHSLSKQKKTHRESSPDTVKSASVCSESPAISPAVSTDPPSKFFRNVLLGEKVYAKPNKSEIWFRAEIRKLPKPGNKKQNKYLVQFAEGERVQLHVFDRQIATFDAVNPNQLEIGSRVVAGRPSDTVNTTISKKYKDLTGGGAASINVMFAGTIAELACDANRFRYLVFFDDGYAQYIQLNRMFLIYASSINVWDDVGDDCRDFISDYLQDYPHRPMVVTNIGNSMLAEWNGQWWESKVVSVDSSLVKLLFDIDQRSEWLYRGTLRLAPLYEFFDNNVDNSKKKKKRSKTESYVDEKIAHPQFGISRFSKTDPKGIQQRRDWNVQSPTPVLSRQSSSSSSSKSSIIMKAPRKKKRIESESDTTSISSEKDMDKEDESSKAGIQSAEQISSQEALGIMAALDLGFENPSPAKSSKKESPLASGLKRSLSVASTDSSSTNRSKLSLKKKQPANLPKPNVRYVPHTCTPDCIKDKRSPMDMYHTGKINYLAVPMMLGWKRESVKRTSGYHRDIYYRTPCNRRLRDLSDIAKYLLQTGCENVKIDMFCFQSSVSCRNDVIRNKPVLIRLADLSKGEERLPVECVNELNTEYPSTITYIKHRVTATGVKVNRDKEFLACCDCTDYCQDKTKCACSRLTLEGRQLPENSRKRQPGYSHRKLREFIPTGVYECNDNCKCSKTSCFNRVVQNGIKVRLQVFRTENRGWGLRCVDDIAKGTFICTYAGEILNEQMANREGKDFGDEYLAELDYIEVAEKSKEGYESDVPELRPGYYDSSSSDEIENIDSDNTSDDESSASVILLSDDMSETDTSEEKSDLPQEKNSMIGNLKDLKVTLRRIPSDEIPKRNDSTLSDDSWSISEKDEKSLLEDTDDNSRNFCDAISSVQSENVEEKKESKEEVSTDDSKDAPSDNGKRKLAKKSTGQKAFFALKSSGKTKLPPLKESNEDGSSTTRRFYDSKGELYIIDAKYLGNVGRYMNHSCSPNLFVQNILVDTHDLRFPWVAFFAQKNIPAFTELTWDYNYEVGSVPNKTLYCQCGSKECKGRIL